MKNKILSFSIILLLISGYMISSAQTLSSQWSLQIGGPNSDRGIKIIADTLENTYFSGTIEKSAYLLSNGITDTINSWGYEDIIFGKINKDGQLLWTKQIGGTGVDAPTDVMISTSGYVFLSGIFEDTVMIGSNSYISQDFIDSFIAKFDSLGNLQWLKQVGGIGNQQCLTMICDKEGDLIAGGFFTNTLEFPQTNTPSIQSQGKSDGFITKWSEEGELLWVKVIPGTGKSMVKDIMIDNNDNYYVIGTFTDSISPDPDLNKLYSVGKTDAFIAQYTSNGDLSWAKSVGGVHDDNAKNLTLGENGKIVMTGEFKEDLFCENKIILSAEGGDDIFHLTFKDNGNLQKHKKLGLGKNDFIFDAWIPVGQEVLMASDLRTLPGKQNITLANYDLIGNLTNVIQTGYNLNPTVLSCVMPKAETIYYCGSFKDTVIFDQITLTSNGSDDMFILKMGQQSDSIDLITQPIVSRNIHQELLLENMDLGELQEQNEKVSFYNYPNPFNSSTQICYDLPEPCSVILNIINVNGNIVSEWQYSSQPAGSYTLYFHGEEIPDGIYYCQLIAKGERVFTSKVIKIVRVK